jgi:hypothetical protein
VGRAGFANLLVDGRECRPVAFGQALAHLLGGFRESLQLHQSKTVRKVQ